jgi:hypothetical protein
MNGTFLFQAEPNNESSERIAKTGCSGTEMQSSWRPTGAFFARQLALVLIGDAAKLE